MDPHSTRAALAHLRRAAVPHHRSNGHVTTLLAGRFCGPMPFQRKAEALAHELHCFATSEALRSEGPPRKDAQT
eukprot:8087860-Lingulodinium_polyedra.AAC.1